MVFIVDKTKQAIIKNTYVKITSDLFFIIAYNDEKVYLLYFVQILSTMYRCSISRIIPKYQDKGFFRIIRFPLLHSKCSIYAFYYNSDFGWSILYQLACPSCC